MILYACSYWLLACSREKEDAQLEAKTLINQFSLKESQNDWSSQVAHLGRRAMQISRP